MTSPSDLAAKLPLGRGYIGHWLPLIIVALIGAIGASAVFYIAAETEDARIRSVLEFRAEWRARDFERKLDTLADSVHATSVMFASTENVDPELFRRFAARSYEPGDPLRRLVWASRVVRDAASPADGAQTRGSLAE